MRALREYPRLGDATRCHSYYLLALQKFASQSPYDRTFGYVFLASYYFVVPLVTLSEEFPHLSVVGLTRGEGIR